MYSKKIFEKAEKKGITKGALGIRLFGRAKYANIYTLKNPTEKTLMKMESALKELIKEKNKK